MEFIAAPRNDFPEFIETYFERCRARVPEIEAIAGKWTLEDLIPGLSDFDVRFIVRDPLGADGWCRMAMEVAAVHLELAQERKDWARTLEHLPGVNLCWSELFDPCGYYPEFAQWSFYHGPTRQLQAFTRTIEQRAWDENETAFHWKKIALYYGPYNRTIDLPINLGPYENKYPLHSRIMHYFAPPVHSLVCLHDHKTGPGKIVAFRRACEIFPNRNTMERVLRLIDVHYEESEALVEPGQTALENELETYLRDAVTSLLSKQVWLQCPPTPSVGELKTAVRSRAGQPSMAQMFELVKFARLMKGRLWFYAHDLAWFDSLPLIRVEMGRIRANFFEQPLQLFAEHCLGKSLSTEQCLNELEGNQISPEQAAACRRFATLADPATPDDQLRAVASQLVECYEPFLDAMETVTKCAGQLASK